ncbi:MAG: diguanylate cyclase [Formivibrio sp.]|nr:diguanylate cyclase [Formivibrio sp.]
MHENDQAYSFAKEHVIRASGLLSLFMPQTLGIGVGVKGLDGRYQLVNLAMESQLGMRAAQIMNKTDGDLFSPDIAEQLQRSDLQILEGAAATSDEVVLSANGVSLRSLWLKFPVIGSDGHILSIGSVVLDISKQADIAELRHSLNLLQQTNHELRKTLAELGLQASTDTLTGAWNRRRLEETVINEMDRLKRYEHPLSLLIIDIDLFKKTNDDFGHLVGDQVLMELAGVIRACLRATDSLTRWGGEEFVVLSPNTTLSTMSVLAERLRKKIGKAVFPVVGTITVSIGGAECLPGEIWEQWFNRADAALYRAKACGRNLVQIAPETPQGMGVGENVSANFLQLSWHRAYECGHALIDDQHRALFGHANKLLAAILSRRPNEEVAALIDALVREVAQHFKDEEKIITAAGFSGAAKHAIIHRELIDKAVILVNSFHAGTLTLGDMFQFLAYDVVARHMLGADREYFPYLA